MSDKLFFEYKTEREKEAYFAGQQAGSMRACSLAPDWSHEQKRFYAATQLLARKSALIGFIGEDDKIINKLHAAAAVRYAGDLLAELERTAKE
jgi:hypothetical protein